MSIFGIYIEPEKEFVSETNIIKNFGGKVLPDGEIIRA